MRVSVIDSTPHHRIRERKNILTAQVFSLIVNEKGEQLTSGALRSRFDKAREIAGIDKASFQFRDLRAKAGTDTEDKKGMEAAKNQLGHANESMTRQYVRHRLGKKVGPTK
ncbi:MAG: tyrosine-type recombinase/integrase [Ottowia sp.]|nr:tyrosine-type recombinase/integrase [Ottowia sp.]